MKTYENFNEIRDSLYDSGVLKVTLATLRDAADYKRLGKGVLEELATKVRGIGAEYFPSYVLDSNENPRGNDEVRLVLADSQVGKLVRAIQDPTESGDSLLGNIAEDNSADVLNQIRNLLGD